MAGLTKNISKENEPEITTKETSNKKPKGKKETAVQVGLPNIWEKIIFKVDGNDEYFRGKVLKKHKPNSKNRNLVIVLLDDESVQQFDFGREVTEWMDIKKSPEYFN